MFLSNSAALVAYTSPEVGPSKTASVNRQIRVEDFLESVIREGDHWAQLAHSHPSVDEEAGRRLL